MLIMLGMLIDLVIFHFSQIMKIPTARSPYTIWNNFVCLVYFDGTIGYGSGNFIVGFSYGSPDNRYNTAWWVGLNGVCDSWMHDGVTYSYGYKIASLSGHT